MNIILLLSIKFKRREVRNVEYLYGLIAIYYVEFPNLKQL